jgi:hypothetical protein
MKCDQPTKPTCLGRHRVTHVASTLIACCLATFCAGRAGEHSAIAASRSQANVEAHAVKQAVTVADSIQMTRFGDPSYTGGAPAKGIVAKFSPNGERFVVVLKRGNLQDDTNEYSLVLFKTADAFHSPTPRVLVSMSSSSNRPAIHDVRWLNDNESLLFLGEHPGEKSQLYSLRCSSKKLRRLTNQTTSLTSFGATPGGDEIAYVVENSILSLVNDRVLRNGFDVTHEWLSDLIRGSYSGGEYYDHSLFIKQRGKTPETKTKLEGRIDDPYEVPMAPSPDGNYFVVQTGARETPLIWSEYEDKWLRTLTRTAGSPGGATSVDQYELVDTHTGTSQVLLDAPIPPNLGSEVAWSPDGQSVIVSNVYLPLTVDDPAEQSLRKSHTFLAEIEVPNRKIIKISDQDLRLVKWDSRTNTVVCEAGRIDSLNGKTTPTIYFRKNGDRWSQVEAPKETGAALPVIVLEEDLNVPPRIVAVDPATGRKSLLMDLNPQFGHITFGKVEELKWRDTLGNEVTGGLYWPPNYVSGRKYPLVIQTHGFKPDRFWIDGPWTTAFAAQPLAGKNFFVLQVPDPDWHLFGTPDEAPRAVAAYEGAIDYLDRRGLVDRNLVGIIGFSRTCYYVTQMLAFSKYPITAAVIADGGDADYFQYFAFSNANPAFAADSEALNGGAPFGEALSSWTKRVSAFHMDQVQAPLRIQALGPASLLSEWSWFSGLSRLRKPVDLIYLPEGTHILEKPWERMVSQQGNLDWFCFWLKGEEDPDPTKAEQYKRWRELRKLQEANDAKATGQVTRDRLQ